MASPRASSFARTFPAGKPHEPAASSCDYIRLWFWLGQIPVPRYDTTYPTRYIFIRMVYPLSL